MTFDSPNDEVDEWNRQYLPGTPVLLVDDYGVTGRGRTLAPARACCGTAIVSVEPDAGRRGGRLTLLSRLIPQQCPERG